MFQAIDAGCAAVRVNPGNIRKFDEVGPSICKAATDAGISLRIGVNAGSLDKELYAKYGGPTPEALVASAMKEARMFEDVGFHDFKISVKHHDVVTMVQTYRLLASKGDWPLHLGVTEAARLAGHNQKLPGIRRAAGRRHRRYDPRFTVRASRGGSEGGLQAAGIHGIAPA